MGLRHAGFAVRQAHCSGPGRWLASSVFNLATQRYNLGAQGINLISQPQASLGVLPVHLTNLLPQLQNGASGLVIGKGLGRQAGEQGGRSEQGNGRETKRLL